MEDFPNHQYESEEDVRIRNLFFDTFPIKVTIPDKIEEYVVPTEGAYIINNHLIKMKPGNIARLDENGVPYLVK